MLSYLLWHILIHKINLSKKMIRGGGGNWTRGDIPSPPPAVWHPSLKYVHQEAVYTTHYSAESLSWYSLALVKHFWTPGSFHNRFIWPTNSEVNLISSVWLTTVNTCRASSCVCGGGGGGGVYDYVVKHTVFHHSNYKIIQVGTHTHYSYMYTHI